MFQHLRKYRSFAAMCIMAFYLYGGLQVPLLEGLHFLSHAPDWFTGQYDSHGFHSHDDQHQHQTLVFLENLDKPDHTDSLPVNKTSDFSVKKFPQCIQIQSFKQTSPPTRNSALFAAAMPMESAVLAIPYPPPRA